MHSIKQKSINGMIWTATERLSLQAVQLLISVILARLLEPSEFGLIGMLAIFQAVAQSVQDSGFGSALIQKKNADQTDASSVFFFNLLVGILIAILFSLSAPLIGHFFGEPILVPLTRVLSLNFIINGFSLVQVSMLTKKLDFKSQMKVSLLAAVASGVIGVVLAQQGFGVWALVGQMLSSNLLKAFFLWFFNSWRPSLIFSMTSLKSMFSFGSRLLVSGLINTFFSNLYNAFIGRVFSATELGYYSKASTFEAAAAQATTASMSKVIYPALAPYQDDNTVLKKAYRKAIRLAAFLQFPLMIGLWSVADPAFRLLLTDKWAPSIPYFQIMCFIGLFYPLHALNLNILQVKGRSDLFLRLEVIKKSLTVLVMVITYRWGIIALLYGTLFNSVISYILNSSYNHRLIGYRQAEQIRDIAPSFFSAAIMGFCMYLIGKIPIDGYLLMIILQIISGVVIYFLLGLFISPNEWHEIRNLIIDTIKNIKLKKKAQ